MMHCNMNVLLNTMWIAAEESITDNADTSLSELRDYVVQSTEADELRRDHQHTVIQSVEQCYEECNKLKEEKRRLLVPLMVFK